MREFMEDDSGVNVLIEYILNFGILLILLSMVWLTYQSIIVQSDNTIAHEEYRIFANDIANRIVLFDSMVESTTSGGGTFQEGPELSFDTPPKLADMSYTIDVGTDTATGISHVTVSSADSNAVVPITATFKTNYPIDPAQQKVSGSAPQHKILFDAINGHIEVT